MIQPTKIFNWIGRILSILSIGLLFIILFAEGFPPLTLLSICFPFGVIVGLIIAWKKQGLGGIITLASLISFYAIHYVKTLKFPGGIWFFLFALPSVFFLVGYLLKPKNDN